MLLVVTRGLVAEELHVVGVLEPASLGHDREIAAKLTRQRPESLSQVGQGTAAQVASISSLTAPPPRASQSASGTRTLAGLVSLTARSVATASATACQAAWVTHQLPSRPAVRLGHRDRSYSSVGAISQRFERRPRLTLLLEELQRVLVHARMVKSTGGDGYDPANAQPTVRAQIARLIAGRPDTEEAPPRVTYYYIR